MSIFARVRVRERERVRRRSRRRRLAMEEMRFILHMGDLRERGGDGGCLLRMGGWGLDFILNKGKRRERVGD